jgi:HAD superfamily phosphoserine phosphatase-like hydrolase
MKERISCFDIDGTLSNGLLFVPLVKSEYASGHLTDDSFAQINKLLVAYKSGRLEYEDAVEKLSQAHAKGLRGESHQDLMTHAETFLESHEEDLFHKFGREVVKILQAEHRLFVVTAEPQYLAEAVAHMYGFDGHFSSVYTEADGKFTGDITQSLAHRTAKASLLQNYDIEYAFGDSEGDIDMLDNARYPYAISPTKGLEATAKERGWQVFDGNDTKSIVGSIQGALL